jgi:chromosome segregation ATPase
MTYSQNQTSLGKNSLEIVIPLVLGVATILGSCGESKISQCNKLIAEINQGQTAYQKSTEQMRNLGNFNPKNPEEMKAQINKVRDSLGAFVQDLRKVSQNTKVITVEDEQLKQLRDSYATQLEAISVGLDDSGKAISSLGAINFTSVEALKQVEASTKQIGDSIQKVSKAGQDANRVVGEINTYCGAK